MTDFGYEQVRRATTAEEMRAELFRLRHRDPLVRACMDSADYSGLSAEDRYTLLAYHAMYDRNKLLKLTLHNAVSQVRPQVMFVKEGECADPQEKARPHP